MDRADPWIIAHAIDKGGAVVTHEQRNPKASSKVKIPNVCEHFGVRCIDVYQMLRGFLGPMTVFGPQKVLGLAIFTPVFVDDIFNLVATKVDEPTAGIVAEAERLAAEQA